MEFYNKNNNSLERVSSKSFAQWASENKQSIEARLIDEGIAFLNEHGEDLRTPVSALMLDNRWHYIDKPSKKQSYRATFEYNTDGIPYLFLTYYTFRHGGHSERFDSKSILKKLWQEARGLQFSSPKVAVKARIESVKPKPNPVDWLACDKNSWELMSSLGTSHYLKRKGLGNVTIQGIKYAQHHIAVAITDTNNAFLGLQRIFNDGQKRFTKGLSKKGHFALIGNPTLPEKINTIHVCEGVATAVSIHQAIGEPVFAALDAFNLLPVCKNLKRHFSKTQIIIWADNDWQKADVKNKFGRVLGNTGLIQANRTAFKLRGTLVCTPDFSTLDAEVQKSATDFNDLHHLGDLNLLSKTLPQKPDIHLGLWHEIRKFNQYAHGAVSPGQFTDGVKLSYNSRYLPNDVFKREGVHLVRSAIGTGKTAIVEHLVKQNPKQSVLFTTHLISLVESAAQRLGLTSYNECDNFDLQIENRLAICLNSLGKLTAEGSLRHYDVVIIDEIEQVLARLTSHIEQKPLVFSVLQHVMTNAKSLICLDAHLSKASIQVVQRFCPNKPVTIHFNEFEPGSARQIAFHDSPESVQMSALQALDQNKNVYLAFNSKKEAFKTYSALSTAFPEKQGLYISSDNAGDAENQAFFNNVNDVSKRYDYLVCTPSVSTGVSIDNGHFDFVGGVFSAQINTANDCMQALGRIRNHTTLHVFCDKRQAFKTLNSDVIASKWLRTHQHDISLMNLDKEGHRIILNPDYEQLTLLVTQSRHASFNDFYQQFALLALQDGMKLTYYDTTLDAATQQQLRQFKKACIEQDVSLINQEQLPLTATQLIALAQKPRKTMCETRMHKKQQLIEFYNLSERDDESIIALANIDNEGRFKKQILALELALGDEALAQKRFVSQLEDGEQFAADLTHFSTLQLLYKKVLATLHLITPHQTLALHDYEYSKETILQSGFITWIEAHRPILQGIISLPSTQILQRDPLRFLSMLLSKMGLKQKRTRRAELGLYHLDNERINLLNALIMRRAKGLAGISAPLDTSSCRIKEPSPTEFFIEAFKKIKQFFSLDCPNTPVFV